MKEDLCEWKENMIYIENSRTARAISCDFVPEKMNERKEENQGIEKRKKGSGGE